MQRASASSATRWAFFGLSLGLLIGLVVYAPASWLGYGVQRLSADRMQWLQTQGSIWSGSAAIRLSAGPGSQDALQLPGRLRWSLGWSSGLTLNWRQDCCMSAPVLLRVTRNNGAWSMNLTPTAPQGTTADLGAWPAAWLAGLGTPWNTLALQGQVQLQTQNLTLSQRPTGWHWQGSLQARFDRMASRLSTLPSLGSFDLAIEGSDSSDSPHIRLSTREGPLQLQGQGLWSAKGLMFQGQATTNPEHEAALGNLLNIIGRRQGRVSVLSFG